MAASEAYPLHGGQLRQIAEQFSTPISGLLDFSANINPSGPPPAVLSTLRASLDDLSTLTEYPDLRQTDLKRSIARYAGSDEESVVVANGFVPLLEATLRALKTRSCLLPVPAFVEYRRTLERMGVEAHLHMLEGDSTFAYEPATMFAGWQDSMLLANPQNPSGVCHDLASMRALITKASERDMYVLLDEAFIDYIPENSLTQTIREFPKLIVFRSVTKFHGIPGLRVAYVIANPPLAAIIGDNLPPWPVTTLAARAVSAALGDVAYAEHARTDNVRCRTSLRDELRRMRLRVYPAAGNFILFHLPSAIDPDAFWQRLILQHGIVLRSCANYDGLADGYFRTAVRTEAENGRLIAAVAESLSWLTPA